MLPNVSVTGLLICICSAVLVSVLGALTWWAHRGGHRLRATVLGLAFLHELALVAFPGWYGAFTGFKAETALGLSPVELLIVYLGEMVFVLLFAGMFFTGSYSANRMARLKPNTEIAAHGDRDRIFLKLLIIGAAALYIGQIFAPTLNYNDLANSTQIQMEYGGLAGLVADWGGAVVRWPGIFGAAMALVDRRLGRGFRALALMVLIAETIFSVINGLRGGVIWVVSAVAIAGYFKSRKRLLIIASGAVLVFAPLSSWMHTNMRYVTLAAAAGTTNWQMIPLMLQGALSHKSLESASVGSNFLETWAIRAIGPLDSIYLYRLYDEGRGASYKPILGTLVYPIPHAVWPDKLIAGSTDNSIVGMAIYRVQALKPGADFIEMGPILASAHAYWEGGWAFLCLAAVFTGWFWNRLLVWAERAQSDSINIVVLVFTAAMPIDGFFDMLNPVFTYVRLFWITLLPTLVLIRILDVWVQRRRTHHRSVYRRLSASQ